MVNTYGITMKGLKKASGETKDLSGYYTGAYVELFYDRSTGEIWTVYQFSLGQNSWTEYHDKNIIKTGNISIPKTMQQIADMIYEATEEIKRREAWEAEIERSYQAELAAAI